MNEEPKSELARLLLMIITEVASINPSAFRYIDITKALKEADNLVDRNS